MTTSSSGSENRGNMERLGEGAGAMAGRAADWGMELSGTLFRSAAEVLGGWWSSESPRQAASAWSDRAERDCRSHFEASAGTSSSSTKSSSSQATNAAPKSQHASMQTAGEVHTDGGGTPRETNLGASAEIGDAKVSGGFEAARPGYQFGYVARQNPAYRGRSFDDVEPELRRAWESGSPEKAASGPPGSWPEVRGFVDFAYQHGEES